MKADYDSANHPDELVDYNLFTSNAALVDALEREGASSAHEQLRRAWFTTREPRDVRARRCGQPESAGAQTLRSIWVRRDEVEFHPAWHELMRVLVAEGLHTSPWARPGPGAHVERAAAYLLWGEIENGTQCPATMTYGAVPALARQSDDFAAWMPRLLSRDYDERLLPIAQKRGALIGMGMTEKQGGSDVKANTTRAVAAGAAGPGKEYRLTGHKWFFSAPMCDAFLVRRRRQKISCFFVPRVLPDGTRNEIYHSDSRTSSATAPMPRAKWSSTTPLVCWWERKAGASRPSSRWASSRASTVPRVRPASSAERFQAWNRSGSHLLYSAAMSKQEPTVSLSRKYIEPKMTNKAVPA